MKSIEKFNEFKNLNSSEVQSQIDSLRKELFDLRFKQATRQLNETHKFKVIKKQIAQLLTLKKNQNIKQSSTD
tara:strand:+ start:1293 stop:1511 length:219 start_codon:yes stop_codon:yes gene_type:complete